MKWIATAVALILLYGLPFHRYDTAKLLPIRCVQAQREGGRIHILSEAGEGYGATWQEAVEDLRRNAPGEVFFDTAEQGVFSDEALARQAAESGDLRPGAEVFFRGALEDPGELYAYLSQHGSNKKIRDYGKVGKGDGREY